MIKSLSEKYPLITKSLFVKLLIPSILLGFSIGSGIFFTIYFWGAICGLTVSWVIYKKPIFGLIILIGFDLSIALFTGSLSVMAIGTIAIIVLIVGSLIIKGEFLSPKTRINTPVDRYLFAFMFIGFIYALIGLLRSNELDSIIGDLYNLVTKLCFMFFLTVMLLYNKEKIREFVHYFLYMTLFFSAGYLVLYFSGAISDFVDSGTGATYYQQSDFVRVGFAPGFPTFHLIFFISLWIYVEDKRIKILTSMTIFLVLLILALTLKRTYWISFAMSLMILFGLLGFREKMKVMKNLFWGGIAISLILILYLGLFSNLSQTLSFYLDTISGRVESINDPQDDSVENRIKEYMGVIKAISVNPLGYGLGSKIKAFSANERKVVYKHYVHNSYLFYSVQVGIFGFSIYLFTLLIYFKEAFKLHKLLEDRFFKGMIMGCIAACIGEGINNLTTLSLNTIYISIALGLIFVIRNIIEKERLTKPITT